MSTTYIIERDGWNQWLDDGGVWRGGPLGREVAREFNDRTHAEEVAAEMSAELGDEDACRAVPK